MKKFLLGVLIGVLFSGLALLVVFVLLVKLAARPPEVADNSVLVLKLRGPIPETPPVQIPLPLFERMAPTTVRDYWELLRKAAADSRIRAVVVMPQGTQAGWGKLQEIRDDLTVFKKSGKPVYAYLGGSGTRDYYVAAAADRVIMPPEDYLDLKGLRAEVLFLKDTLDKIGVKFEFEHAGKYKDAPDMFTRDSMSPETREVLNSLLDDLYGQLTDAIATGRKKTPDQVRSIIDQGPFLGPQAVAAGLVDELLYQDQMFDEIERRLKMPDLNRVSEYDYLKVPPESVGVETGRHIAFLTAEGDIIRGGDTLFPNNEVISSSAMGPLLRRIREDRSIKGVILRIDSPGGDGFASDEIWREMTLLSKAKPLVISMSDMAASGGYYIAMTGDPIIAYPGTYTGSIGVFFGKADLRGLYEKLGMRKQILMRGRFADIDSDYAPLSEAARAKLREGVDAFYADFLRRVADGRKKTVAQIEPVAQGRVWLGSQAKANGLIDGFGGIDRAIELLKQKAGIPRTEQVKLISYPPQRTLWEQLFGRPGEALTNAPQLAFLKRFATYTWMHGGMLKVVPYTIEVK
jgi:protease-4